MNTKKFSMLLVASLAFMVMSSCHGNGKEQKQENQTEEKQEASNIEGIDIAKMVKDEENTWLINNKKDTVSWPADMIRLEEYWKQPCLYLAPNVAHYLDSIAELIGLPTCNDYDGEGEKTINHAVHELRRFQIGERKYYPEQEVNDAFRAMSHGFYAANGHADDSFYYFAYHYLHCFGTQAALLCPNVEFVSDCHSEDHQVGLLSDGSGNTGPLFTAIIYKSGDRCIFQMVDIGTELGKIFHLTDDDGRDYYLLTSGYSNNEIFYYPILYLYERRNDVLCLAAQSEIPHVEMANGKELFFSECRFNPTKLQWDLCNEGEGYWYKIDGTKSFYLHLDGEKPYFEVH